MKRPIANPRPLPVTPGEATAVSYQTLSSTVQAFINTETPFTIVDVSERLNNYPNLRAIARVADSLAQKRAGWSKTQVEQLGDLTRRRLSVPIYYPEQMDVAQAAQVRAERATQDIAQLDVAPKELLTGPTPGTIAVPVNLIRQAGLRVNDWVDVSGDPRTGIKISRQTTKGRRSAMAFLESKPYQIQKNHELVIAAGFFVPAYAQAKSWDTAAADGEITLKPVF